MREKLRVRGSYSRFTSPVREIQTQDRVQLVAALAKIEAPRRYERREMDSRPGTHDSAHISNLLQVDC